MPGIHLGKIPSSRIIKMRDVIFSEMLNENIITTEVLFYTLLDQGIPKETATLLALKCHFGGKKINSAYLKQQLLDNYKLEYTSKQITFVIKKFIKSTRIELVEDNVLSWRINGFSTQERPFIAGVPPGYIFPDTNDDIEADEPETPVKDKLRVRKKKKNKMEELNMENNEEMKKVVEEEKEPIV